ncbi:MAG TPA: outer membrane lipoprotein carrier protein LolA [Spirochaetota bacterium]|nr:outer membrane lipoprotein carrier protein LolA [Spirochaetota bacterium]HPU89210.1 outer membrane lipoprotein carrier protein LolA [Spirochaetota bacterium]
MFNKIGFMVRTERHNEARDIVKTSISRSIARVCAASLFALCMLAVPSNSQAFKFDFTTVSDVVKKIRTAFGKIDSYQADFTITTQRLGKNSMQSGTVKYKSPDKLLVEFSQPAGQRIVSNGKTMWIYIPSMNVVAEQDLKSDSGNIIFSGTKSGLRRLFSKYHYKFAGREQPEPQPDGTKMYTLMLVQKESRSGYRTMKLWVTEQYSIARAYGETSTGKKVDILFRNVRTDANFPNGLFAFDMPARAKLIKNPMVAEE